MKHFGLASVLALATLLTPVAAVFGAPAVLAQGAAVRNLTGEVTDKAGNKVKGAVVHLKDTRSLSQRSYITADDGAFRFGALSTSTDYEVWADLGDKKTPSKAISSFDSKATVDVALKMPN
ncbi:MAG: carboxypeptidase-like regulatory domain-containing protein [Janthinobacterium lividum]